MAFQDIRKSRKWLSVEETRLLLLFIVLFAGLLALNIYLARILPGGEQLYLRWSGARAFLFEKTEPYSLSIAERTQQIAYGRAALSREYPYLLNDPFHIVLLYVPLAVLPEIINFLLPSVNADFAVVRGVWMFLSEAAIALMMVSFINALEWKPPFWLYGLLLAFSLGGYYSLLAIGSGSPASVFVFLFFAILLSLRSFNDELAGAILFAIGYQWEVSAAFFLFVVIFVLANRRWRVLNGFGMSLAVLITVSFLAYPGWAIPFFRAVLSDWYRGFTLTFGHVMALWFPEANFSIGFWVALLLGIVLVLEWAGSIDVPYRHIAWTGCVSLAVTPLLGFAVFPENHVVLLPSFILIVMLAWERWTRYRAFYVLLIFAAAFGIPFWLYYHLINGAPQIYADLLKFLPPVSAVVGLYWMRWWAIRSPRTFFDQVGGRK